MTGKDLKLKRIDADVKAKDLAAAMGVEPSRVSYIESRRVVTDEARDKYLAALLTCTTNSTPEAAA